MNNNNAYLFVYGSLRSGLKNPAYEYLAKYFTYAGEGLVKGKFYDNGSYPVAVASNNEDMIVGELYKINNEDEFIWAFEQLDDYEGVHVEQGQTPLYKRNLVEVYQDDVVLPAYIYWYNGSVEALAPIKTGDLIDYIQQKK